ncbi:MAG: helix-turn-helix transcriptional regulator [Ruminococcaceae bacterium]|nr:helix-turn-helix transcriptional regulator [Oscillospiraceae bacterium]
MGIEMIGKQIAAMRKERRIRQEELANYVGVSAQAVSKWENGGVPDTELLPRIADFFKVSVDHLFGRNQTDHGYIQSAPIKYIGEMSMEQRFKLVFEYCWDMERALYGIEPKDGGIEDYEKELGEQEQRYSSVISDYGFTRMGIANKIQYFLLVPEIKNTETAFFDGVDYADFFKDLSDKDVFNALVMLNKRDSEKAFTPYLLEKNMKIEKANAVRIITILEKYKLLRKTQIETDDEIQTVYNFIPTPSFIALLIFAREMIRKPRSFSYYSEWRNKPFFK